MKKSVYILMAACLLAACKGEMPEQVGHDGEAAGQDGAGVIAGSDRQSVQLTFTSDLTATRTALGEDWSVSWCEGDAVSIVWKGGAATSAARLEDGKAFFSATVEDVSEYYAVYPSSIPASVGADGKLSLQIPSSQGGKFADCAVIVAHTTREALDFGRFHSALGLIRFSLDDDAIRQVRFSSSADENVCGAVSTDAACQSFMADATSPVIDVAVEGKGTYYLAMLPGVSLPGLKFQLGTETAWKGEAVSTKPASVSAGEVLCINTPVDSQMEVVGDFYISVSGSGSKDGSSKENAGDLAFLKTLLTSETSAAALSGHTVHLSAGTYDLATGDKGMTLAFDTLTDFTLSGEAGTVITTSLSGEEGCILTVASANVNLTLDGITFTGASHNGTGGALCLIAGKHTLQNCTFSGNETTSTTADRVGGAVYVGGTAAADIIGCTFTGNKVKITGGGALAFFTTATCRVLGCTFKGNNPDKIGNGGAILQKKAGNILYVSHCTFDGNACATNGPDIFSSAGTALLLYNCTHVNPANSSAGNLGFVRANVPVFVANCTFAAATVGEANGELAFGVSGAEKNYVINNLMLCDTGNSLGTASSTTKRDATTYGHNVLTRAPLVTWTDKGSASDLSGISFASVFPSGAVPSGGVLAWTGPSSLEGFVPATSANIETAMKAYPQGGADFHAWLVAQGCFDKDGAGNTRIGAWWPGAYQKPE